MMRSLFSAVTGLRNHQTRMDVIGNNIANVNTVGYKSSRVVFQDIYSQTIKPASGGNGASSGGTNPMQIGLGSAVASIDVLHTASASEYTGADLDMAVEGDGYFTLSSGGELKYTRAGNFTTDKSNYLVSATGAYVQGFQLDTDGSIKKDADGNPLLTNILIDPKYTDVSIDSTGAVVGLDSTTNKKVTFGQLALATFANQNGLSKSGSNTYTATVNSGVAVYNKPGTGDAGILDPGSLEMSNVDLASEFTDMVVTQRGFQANSRVITTSDSMLEELVNLKR